MCKHKKRSLESVFGVVRIPGHTPAHTQHQRTVPAHQSLERDRVLGGSKAGEQFDIGRTGLLQLPQNFCRSGRVHQVTFRPLLPAQAARVAQFFREVVR